MYLDKDIHGLAHISEMMEMYPDRNINDLVRIDEEYDWKILSIEAREHRMGLVLIDKKAKAVEIISQEKAKKNAEKEGAAETE